MTVEWPEDKNCHIAIYYSEDGSRDDLVMCARHGTPEMTLSCIIDRLSGSTVFIYKNLGPNATYSMLNIGNVVGTACINDFLKTFLYRTIHIPEFHTAKELEMKLELSA